MKKTSIIFSALLLAAGWVATPPEAQAQELAIQGYDPVAYFVQRKPLKGSKQYQFSWNDITWRFSSEKNLNRFKKNPKKYAPQYNGWCAYAVSSGYAAEIDPINGWSFNEGKLYLNWSSGVKFLWKVRKKHYIDQANQNWPDVHKRIVTGNLEIHRK